MKLIIVSIIVNLMGLLGSAHPPCTEWEKANPETLDAENTESRKLNSKKLEFENFKLKKSDEEKSEMEEPISQNSDAEVGEFEKLPIKFYYEALCPDSRAIMADLGRVYHIFKNYLALEFVPFGRAHSSVERSTLNFTCDHGPKECVGNRIQSCGLAYLSNQDAQLEFVVCRMKQANDDDDDDQTGEQCLKEAGGDWSKVSECIDGSEGIKLQLEAEAETKEIAKPRLKNVPTVVFNDKYDQELQDKAVKGLKGVFCELLADKKLSSCD